MAASFPYRLALDLGPTSIGWAVLRLNHSADNEDVQPVALVKTGVRIFSDGRHPKDGSSLAVERRLARQMRRRRDRLLSRKKRLISALIKNGFFPADEGERRKLVLLDPYQLRAKGVNDKLTPQEFGRAIFHLNQRRGFKSNRKTDREDSEHGILKTSIMEVRKKLEEGNAKTVGEWLAQRHVRRETVRARLRGKTVRDKQYDLYVDRAMIEEEFNFLWEKQSSYHPTLYTEELRRQLHGIIFFQRPLKPVDPGRCTLLPDHPRAPLAAPIAQRFRIYQEINNLRIEEGIALAYPLSKQQRDLLFTKLDTEKDLLFKSIPKLLKLSGDTRFNLEDKKRDRLKGNETSKLLCSSKYFGKNWHTYTEEQQEEIVEQLINEDNPALLANWLQQYTGCGEVKAHAISDARLPSGYSNLSRKALEAIVPHLKADVITFDKAVQRAALGSHSALSHMEKTGEILQHLPYYGQYLQRHVGFGSQKVEDPPEKRFGRIANPTVHIALNQIRIVVNALIKRYGHPQQIVVEVARDLKMSRERRQELEREQAQRQKQNEKWREEIREIRGDVEPTQIDMQKMRLWYELNSDAASRCCPYTGTHISLSMLFSDQIEIEHILPFSRTLDDSLNNKTVCLRQANRDKSNMTPYEAFSNSPPGYSYDQILLRAAQMKRDKAKRFAPDGYQLWLRENKDFLARALNDTSYISRIAKEYMTLICPPNQVWVTPGRLTALLRSKYGFNRLLSGTTHKNRNDHRHHALDAVVVGISDRGLLQRIATASGRAYELGLGRLIDQMPLPWPRLYEQVAHSISHLRVSHRPDHGYEGQMMEAFAWGFRPDGTTARKERDQDGTCRLKLKNQHLIKIADGSATHRHGITKDGKPQPYKGYVGGSNFCIEIVQNENGKWGGEVISTYDAYQFMKPYQGNAKAEGFRLLNSNHSIRDRSPLVMRLHRNDTVLMCIDGTEDVWRVVKISRKGEIIFAKHNEANVDARKRDKTDPYEWTSRTAGGMQRHSPQKVTVSPCGQMKASRMSV
jgi:CRISPR-associated endonuclease Csn1